MKTREFKNFGMEITLSALALAVSVSSSSVFAYSKPAPLASQPASTSKPVATITAPIEPVPSALQQKLKQEQNFYELHSAQQIKLSGQSNIQSNSCDNVDAGYGSKTGQALVDHILNNPSTCIDALFNGNATAISAFQADKMYTVANATAALASSYNPATASEETIGKLYYFLRTGYYVQYYNSSAIPEYPSWVKTAVRSALDNLFANPQFYSSSDIHGKNIQDALTLIDSAGENARYLYVIKQWLNRWDINMAASWNMRAAVNGIFTVLFRGHYDNSFVQAATNDSALIQQLSDFATSDWMLNSNSAFMQENAAAELSRFLQYSNTTTSALVSNEIGKILNKYSMNGQGASVWLKTASTVDYYNRCSEFNICGFSEQLEQQVLSINHSCNSSMKFRVQDMTTTQLNDSCNTVTEQESFFHQFLVTNQQPVADDLNSSLEMVVFNSSDDYGLYAGIFFGIDTDNGGMYLEGNPAAPNNQARFIAYEAEWMRPDFEIWNLTHEMVHYLDGRFNLKGNFADARTDTHNTVWWIEGLAEYVSKKNRNDQAVQIGSSKRYKISEIFKNNYFSGTERVYHWGYLAVRFMFERQPEIVNQLLVHFKAGDYDAYLNAVNAIGTSLDTEWLSWLTTVQSNDSIPEVTIGNTNTPEPGNNELINGETKLNLTAQKDQWLHHYIDIAAGQSKLTITQSNGSGDADLYVKFGQQPDKTSFDCRPYRTGNNESCEFQSPAAGRWYVSSYGYNAFNGVSLKAATEISAAQPNACSTQAPVSYIQLEAESQYCVAQASNGDYTYFYMYNSVDNASYTFNLYANEPGNADLYFSNATWPTASNFQQKSANSNSNESITTPTLPIGWIYISVHANTERPDTTLSVTLN